MSPSSSPGDPSDPTPHPEDPGLVLTGERTLPGIPDEAYWFARHEVAYRLAAELASGRTVLDAGCGEGYGLEILAAAGALRVIGADLDEHVVEHVRRTYAPRRPDTIEAVACELMSLPLADDEVDLTVSFQVIEHLHDIPGYLASLRRVTRPGGAVVIATPNRLTFTPGSDTPINPFHTREFTAVELEAELEAAGLEVTEVLGVHHGARIRSVERVTGRRFTDVMTSRPPEGWPRWYRRVVHRVRVGWFAVHHDDLDTSLDLVAVCRVPQAGS
jgi:SAM-dependent methyltransferase